MIVAGVKSFKHKIKREKIREKPDDTFKYTFRIFSTGTGIYDGYNIHIVRRDVEYVRYAY